MSIESVKLTWVFVMRVIWISIICKGNIRNLYIYIYIYQEDYFSLSILQERPINVTWILYVYVIFNRVILV